MRHTFFLFTLFLGVLFSNLAPSFGQSPYEPVDKTPGQVDPLFRESIDYLMKPENRQTNAGEYLRNGFHPGTVRKQVLLILQNADADPKGAAFVLEELKKEGRFREVLIWSQRAELLDIVIPLISHVSPSVAKAAAETVNNFLEDNWILRTDFELLDRLLVPIGDAMLRGRSEFLALGKSASDELTQTSSRWFYLEESAREAFSHIALYVPIDRANYEYILKTWRKHEGLNENGSEDDQIAFKSIVSGFWHVSMNRETRYVSRGAGNQIMAVHYRWMEELSSEEVLDRLRDILSDADRFPLEIQAAARLMSDRIRSSSGPLSAIQDEYIKFMSSHPWLVSDAFVINVASRNASPRFLQACITEVIAAYATCEGRENSPRVLFEIGSNYGENADLEVLVEKELWSTFDICGAHEVVAPVTQDRYRVAAIRAIEALEDLGHIDR